MNEEDHRMIEDDHRRIRERAYEIWCKESQPHGRDREHWQVAQAEIKREDKDRMQRRRLGVSGSTASEESPAVHAGTAAATKMADAGHQKLSSGNSKTVTSRSRAAKTRDRSGSRSRAK